MHRLIMTSSVYRQSSKKAVGSSQLAVGSSRSGLESLSQSLLPTAKSQLPSFPLRRVEAEVVRDSVLVASGSLNRKQFGPAIGLQSRPDGEVVAPDGPDGWRRSIYLFVGRKVPVTMLHLFDQPIISVNCTRRGTSTLASQALDLLNSDFMIKQSELFADRLIRESAPPNLGRADWDPAASVSHAFRCAFARPPSSVELAEAVEFLKSQSIRHASSTRESVASPELIQTSQRRALADLCHMLLSANEFVYVE